MFNIKNEIGLFQPGWVRAKILPMTEDNFDAWELSLRNVFYANDWNALIEAVDDSDKARAKVIPELRKIAWGCVTASLSYDLGSLTAHIPLGEVGKLIRTIFEFHFRNSASSRGGLKDKLHGLKLKDYKTFELYVSSLKSLLRRLRSVGYVVDEEDKIHYLLKGLPPDYDLLKQAI